MNRILQFTLFISVFTSLYIILNSYVVLRIGSLLKIEPRLPLYFFIVIVTFALPFVTFIEKFLPNILTRALYTISALWMGVMFLLFICLIIYELLNLLLKIDSRIAGIVILSIVAILTIYSIFNAFRLEVNEVDIELENLKKEVKVVQLSDIHIGTIRNSAFLNEIARKTNELDPDIVVITGDLVDGSAPLHSGMFSEFDKLRAPVFFVTGNHETYEGTDKVFELFNKSKIKVLKNEVATFDGVQVIGVNFSMEKGFLKKSLKTLKINKSKPSILLYHEPKDMVDAKDAGIDLQLSGHTHNGQIFPFNFIVKLVLPYINGLYSIDGMHLYVNPGTGTWGPYMRLGSRNEITLLNLKPAD